jgi:hypothetical protein
MGKEAISVTLEAQNLLWLRGQVRASGRRSVSDAIDRLVTEARTGGRIESGTIRSVVGTVRLPANDPDLTRASHVVRRLFPASSERPKPGGRSGPITKPGARKGRRTGG